MSLLTEINETSKLVPLETYLKGIAELGVDFDDEIVEENIISIIENICNDDIEAILTENRSEWQASQEMLRGYGVKDPQAAARRTRANELTAHSRLGLRATQPEPGAYVKLAGDGVGRVESVEGDVVRIKPNNSPYPIETPLKSLVPREVTDKKGKRRVVWLERFKR